MHWAEQGSCACRGVCLAPVTLPLPSLPSPHLPTRQGYYRGASKGPVKLTVRVTGIAGSSWPSTVRYCALVLPTSRPLPPDCQQGASSDVEQDGSSSSGDGADAGGGICSPLELADAWNLTGEQQPSMGRGAGGRGRLHSAGAQSWIPLVLCWGSVLAACVALRRVTRRRTLGPASPLAAPAGRHRSTAQQPAPSPRSLLC